MEANRVGDTVRHRGDARPVLDDDVDVNVNRLAVEADGHAARRLAGEAVRQPLRQVARRQPHHAVGFQRGAISDGGDRRR